jgi:long-chain acyl-CoA synthetase
MLSHAAISWTARVSADVFNPPGADRRQLSYLPLAHIAEQQASIHSHVANAGSLYFARSMDTVAEDLRHVRPTGFFGVPRVWEKMQARILQQLDAAPPTRRKLALWAMKSVRAVREAELEGRPAGFGARLQADLGRALVVNRIREALGLDQSNSLVSGAAPISTEVLRFFLGLDLMIYEGYGQSETGAPTSANRPGHVKIGSVGRPFDGIEAKVDEDGELLILTPGIFSGYMKDNEATEASFTPDGWLRTGDLARIDEDGFIFLTGRKKDIIITSGGKNITPSNIETALMDIPLVEHAVLTGDGRPFIGALLTLSEEGLMSFKEQVELSAPPHESPEVRAEIQKGVDRVNKDLARVEQVREFRVLETPLTVEAGELTPTLKVKRRIVLETRADAVASIYGEHVGEEPYR